MLNELFKQIHDLIIEQEASSIKDVLIKHIQNNPFKLIYVNEGNNHLYFTYADSTGQLEFRTKSYIGHNKLWVYQVIFKLESMYSFGDIYILVLDWEIGHTGVKLLTPDVVKEGTLAASVSVNLSNLVFM